MCFGAVRGGSRYLTLDSDWFKRPRYRRSRATCVTGASLRPANRYLPPIRLRTFDSMHRVIIYRGALGDEPSRLFWTEQEAAEWCEAEGIGIEPPFSTAQRRAVIQPFKPRVR